MVLQAVGRFHLHVLPVIPVLLMVLILGDRCVGAIEAFVTGVDLAIGPLSHIILESLASPK